MARKSSSKSKKTITKEDVGGLEDLFGLNPKKEVKEIDTNKTGVKETKIDTNKIDVEETKADVDNTEIKGDETEVVLGEVREEPKKKKTLADLSTDELRLYQRTGIMPE